MPRSQDYGMAHTVEVFCTHCGRRYLVSDTKVRGRRCSAPCKCGKRILIDGRRVRKNSPPKPTALARVRLKRTASRPGRPSDPPPTLREISVTPPPAASANRMVGDSQPLAEEPERASSPPSSTPFSLRPKAPPATWGSSESAGPDEPRDLGEAILRLEDRLDQAAETFRPAWETDDEPSSRQITPAGEVPEVTVHYPQDWQPPPSERVRKRKAWQGVREGVDREAVDRGAVDRGAVDRGAVDRGAVDRGAVDRGAWAATPQAAEETESEEKVLTGSAVVTPSPVTKNLPAQADSVTDSMPPPAPAAEKLDSTAPTAISQLPPPPQTSRRSGWLAAAGLAALALLGVGIQLSQRDSSTTPALQPISPMAASRASRQADNADGADETASRAAAETPTAGDAEAADTATLEPEPDSTLNVAPQEPLEREDEPAATPEKGSKSDSPKEERAALPRVKERTPSPAPESVGLDPQSVRGPLAAAASRARACASPYGPTGSGSVRVLFNPDGGVLRATVVGAPFAGTPTGSCVERAFRNAGTPPYRGRTQSTVYGFSLR